MLMRQVVLQHKIFHDLCSNLRQRQRHLVDAFFPLVRRLDSFEAVRRSRMALAISGAGGGFFLDLGLGTEMWDGSKRVGVAGYG